MPTSCLEFLLLFVTGLVLVVGLLFAGIGLFVVSLLFFVICVCSSRKRNPCGGQD